MRTIKRLVLLGLVLYLGLWAFRIVSRKYYVWLPGYLRWSTGTEESASGPVHLFFLFADHFEPGENYHFMERWLKEYPALAARHRDSTGRRSRLPSIASTRPPTMTAQNPTRRAFLCRPA